jgi:hypothetical protein
MKSLSIIFSSVPRQAYPFPLYLRAAGESITPPRYAFSPDMPVAFETFEVVYRG